MESRDGAKRQEWGEQWLGCVARGWEAGAGWSGWRPLRTQASAGSHGPALPPLPLQEPALLPPHTPTWAREALGGSPPLRCRGEMRRG